MSSTIDLLPLEIKAQLQQLLQDPRCTQLQVTAEINALLEAEGHEERVSKSAVNRYAVKMSEVGEKLRQSREVADMYISKVGAAPQGQMGLLINEILRTLAFDISLKIQTADLKDPETLASTIDQLKALALAMQRLESAAATNVKRDAEIQKEERERLKVETLKIVDSVEASGPMTAELLRQKIREVYGV